MITKTLIAGALTAATVSVHAVDLALLLTSLLKLTGLFFAIVNKLFGTPFEEETS